MFLSLFFYEALFRETGFNILFVKRHYSIEMTRQLTAIIEREDNGYVALCPEGDVASQGATVDEARKNLKEALDLFFEYASTEEIQKRFDGWGRNTCFKP